MRSSVNGWTRPRIAYAQGVYLVAWHEKDVTDDDDVWFQIRDSSFAVRSWTEVSGRAFLHGEIVSIIILRPASALSISRCTRSVSDLRNSCSPWSSNVSPSSSLIDFEVNSATDDIIRSLSLPILAARSSASAMRPTR